MKLHSPYSPSPSAALFGKLPCALDFVRVNHSSAESIALDRWIQAALQRLLARSRPWPPGQFAFTFAIDEGHSLVGVATDSRDRAGRRFPLAVYARLPRPPLVPHASAALVLASEAFVVSARALLAQGPELSQAQVPLRLRRLGVPGEREVSVAAEVIRGELGTLQLGAFAAPLFPDTAAPERCVLSALEQLRGRRSARGSAFECFECPARSLRDVAVWAYWLELAHGRPCAALWDLPGRERVLLAPGPLPERAALFWERPAQAHPQLCRVGADATPAPLVGDDPVLAALFEQLVRGAGALPGAGS